MMSLLDQEFNKALVYSASDIAISELRIWTILSDRIDVKKHDQITHRCQDHSVVYATQDDSNYHFKFSLIYSAPYIVYWMGDIELLNRRIMGIVWPRQCSSYAQQVMEQLFSVLPGYDVVTVSGMAPGVDTMAHEMSIKANIPTIAILGGGLRYFTKSKSREFLQKIVDRWGLVISEFRLDQWPERYTFPQRNRIVAGLSDMVFLPEAGEKSWSLITVDFARQMHKDVYGTPHTIFSQTSKWLHRYMQQGLITPVIDRDMMLGKYFGRKQQVSGNKQQVVEDNLFDSDDVDGNDRPQPLFSKGETQVIEILQKNPAWLKLEELVSQTGLGIEDVMSQLTIAEVMGQVMNDGGAWRGK